MTLVTKIPTLTLVTVANSAKSSFLVKEETSITLKKKSRGVGHRSRRIKKFGSNVS